MKFDALISLAPRTSEDFSKNLKAFYQEVTASPTNSIILAPEVAFSDFCYDKMQEASEFTATILQKLLPLSENKAFAFTAIDKQNEHYFNNAYILYRGQVVYKRAKNKLFTLGNEHHYFQPDHFQKHPKPQTDIIEIQGTKIGVLVCFELRFIDEWQKLKGCDVILIPAMWGKNRIVHYRTLSHALAVFHQCFVVSANGANLCRDNSIYTPFGHVQRNNRKICNALVVDKQEIKKMRKYVATDND